MTIEDLFCETGGFGRFQLFVLLGVGLTRFTIGWSMLQMSYDGMVSDWFCLSPNVTKTENGSFKSCFLNTSSFESVNGRGCEKIHFVGSPLTIINQWDLVCSLNWVRATVITIQMSGVLLGALLAGQMGDSLGRKMTLYLFVLEHAILNLITAFSVTWQMFAACRFFVGLGIGGVLVSSIPYPLEFLPVKWRPLVSVLPIWSLGICVFALASWLIENWSYLHIACGVLSIPGLLGYFYVPESIRWLTVHNRMTEATDVVMKIAITNHMLQPRKASITLQAVAWEEQKVHDSNKQYTYIDIFRDWPTATTTLIFCFHWFTLSLVYYGISFSVASLAGNIYVNVFLLAVVEIPAILSTFYFDDKLGRKWTSIVSLAVACVPLFVCLIVEIHAMETSKPAIITALCVVAKIGTGAAWAVGETWCSEFYPTVTRCLGFGTVTMAAATAAIIMPFLINLDDMAIVSFSVMGSLLLVDIVLCFFTPETKGLELADTPTNVKVAKDLPEEATIEADTDNEHTDVTVTVTDDSATSNNVQKVEKTVLENVEEESSDKESDKDSVDSTKENETTIDQKSEEIANDTPETKIKKNKHHKRELKVAELKGAESKTEKGLKTPSPRASPLPSPKWKKLEKLMSKPKPQDDSPPYIESSQNKNVRFSIY